MYASHILAHMCARTQMKAGSLCYSLIDCNTITTSYLTLLSMKSVAADSDQSCAEMRARRNLLRGARAALPYSVVVDGEEERWERRRWWASADGSSVAQCACWYLLLCQRGLNQVRLQWGGGVFRGGDEKAVGLNILFLLSRINLKGLSCCEGVDLKVQLDIFGNRLVLFLFCE